MSRGRFNGVWLAFFGLTLVWGTSFLFIKVALQTLAPITLVALRLLIGWVALLGLARWRGVRLPAAWATWRHLLFLGAVNTALPFVLITWGESGPDGLDSGMASVLNSTVPLFTVITAGLLLHQETVSGGTFLGLALGFAGVLLLVSRDLQLTGGSPWPALAVVAAALCYAIGSTYARANLRGVSPIAAAFGQILVADVFAWVAALALEPLATQRLTPLTIGSLLWLGLLGSGVAYVLYFHILQAWGATRTTLVTYVIPVVGVTAGALILGELVDWRLAAGGFLILGGVGLVSR